MTTKQFYSEYWKPLILTIVPTILLTSFSSYLGVRVAIAETKKDVQRQEERFNEHLLDFEFYKQKDEAQGKAIHVLQLNQLSISKDCKIDLPYKYENVRGDRL